jgi:hypothetical protein
LSDSLFSGWSHVLFGWFFSLAALDNLPAPDGFGIRRPRADRGCANSWHRLGRIESSTSFSDRRYTRSVQFNPQDTKERIVKNPKCWFAVLVACIVGNVLDYIVQGKWLTSAYYSKIDSIRSDTPIYQFVIGGLAAVLVLAWVLNRLSSSFGSGAGGGATAGFYLGVLVNFPTFHFIFLMFKGYPYPLVWINTIYGVVWYMIIGAVLAAIMRKPLAADTAS